MVLRAGVLNVRIFKLQKRALRIITNSKYNAHTEPLFKNLNLLKIKDIFDIECLKFWYKFVNKKLPNYFRTFFMRNNEMYDIETRNHDSIHSFLTRTTGARHVLRHHIPGLIEKYPSCIVDKSRTHSITVFVGHIKHFMVESYSYDCLVMDCYICNSGTR